VQLEGKSETSRWGVRAYMEPTLELLVEEGTSLECIVLSVQDVSREEEAWEIQKGWLAPLNGMARKATWVLGQISARGEREDELEKSMREYVRELNSTRH
jgi:hypothetical protein